VANTNDVHCDILLNPLDFELVVLQCIKCYVILVDVIQTRVCFHNRNCTDTKQWLWQNYVYRCGTRAVRKLLVIWHDNWDYPDRVSSEYIWNKHPNQGRAFGNLFKEWVLNIEERGTCGNCNIKRISATVVGFLTGKSDCSTLTHATSSQLIFRTVTLPDDATGTFHWHNSSCRTVILGSTQPITDMSTWNICWGVKEVGAYNLTTFMWRMCWNLSLNLLEPSGPVQGCTGLALPSQSP
jgi:hypothetical protein